MVKFNDLYSQYQLIKDKANKRLDKMFQDSSYINGPDVEIFEKNFATYVGAKYAVGVSNGTDAIKLSVKALQHKYRLYDETTLYIVPSNTFIATVLGIQQAGGIYIQSVDCDEYYQIDISKLEE